MYGIARAPTLDLAPWRRLLGALDEAFRKINATAEIICGKYGAGPPLLDDNAICFNGNYDGRRWWIANGKPKISDYDDAHENFELVRVICPATGYFHHDLITRGKPYTLAVRAAMLLLRHHFPHDSLITHAPGTLDDWYAAWILTRETDRTVRMPSECMPRITPYVPPREKLIYVHWPGRNAPR